MKKLAVISLAAIFVLILVSFSHGQTLFDNGLKEFNQENYEEALSYFLQGPGSRKRVFADRLLCGSYIQGHGKI